MTQSSDDDNSDNPSGKCITKLVIYYPTHRYMIKSVGVEKRADTDLDCYVPSSHTACNWN